MKTLHTIYTSFAKRVALILTLLLTLGVTSAWAAEELAYTITFSNSTNGVTAIETSTQATTVIAENARTYVTTKPFSNITNSYYGGSNTDEKSTIRIGKSNATGAITIALSENGKVSATKVVVNCRLYNSGKSATLSVNNKTAQNISSSFADLTFEINDNISAITLTTSLYAYIKSISVYTATTEEFEITWNNGGHGTAPTSPTSASSVELPSLTTTGYTHAGWTANVAVKNGSTTISTGELIENGTTVTLTQATTFTAQWEINSYKVTWEPNGGNWSGNASDKVEDYNYGATITTPTNPTRYGYNFTGWNPTPATTMPASDQTYTAQWSEKSLTNYRTTCTTQPSPSLTASESSLSFGEVTINSPQQLTFTLSGSNLTADATLALSGTNEGLFSVSPTSVTPSNGSITDQIITVTYTPDAKASHFATLTISSTGAEPPIQISLSGTGVAQTAEYNVEHYRQNIVDDGYTLCETETSYGEVDASVTPAVKTYEGFTAPSTQTVTILSDGSTTVKYQYTRNSYTLTWNVNGGNALTGDYTSGSVKYEATITKPTDPTREGYRFSGWHDGTAIVTPATTMPANNLTYTAQWTKLHTITWKVNGEEYIEGTPTISVEDGNAITHLPTAPDEAPSGCSEKVFVGWTDSEISEETDTKPTTLFTDAASAPAIDGDKTFHAVFADEEGGGGGTTAQSITTYQDGTYYLIDSFTDANGNTTYHSPKGTGAKIPSEDMTEYVSVDDNVLTLNLTNAPLTDEMKYTISKENDSYSIHNSATTKYVGANASGTDLNTTTSAWKVDNLEGKRFMFWYQEGDKSARSFLYQDSYNGAGGTKTHGRQFGNYAKSVAGTINNQSGKECYGSGYFFLVPATRGTTTGYTTLCDAKKAKVTYDLNGGEYESDDCVSQTVMKGQPFNLCSNTPTKEGYTFAGWTDGVNTYAAGATVTVNESTTFYAKWTAKTITITWDQNYTDCPEAATSTYIYDGEEIAMPAEPIRTGYKFTGWFTDATDGTQVTEVGETNKPTADVTYYAHWAQLYTVTFRASGQVYVVQEHKYLSGETLELPADPSAANYACDGYIFEGWSADEKTEDATKPGLISNPTITNDETYYAVWKKATTEGAGETIFYESFNKNDAAGGNDGNFNTASNTEECYVDNEGWEGNKFYEADQCIKLGGGSAKGYIITPTLSQLSGNATLSFKAAAWNGSSESTTLVLSIAGGGSLSKNSVTLTKGAWQSYEVAITGGTSSTRITFAGKNTSNSRFFLDEVKVTTSGSYNYTTSPSCGPTIVAKEGMWVTSANSQSVKVNVPIAIKSFTNNATITGTTANTNFVVTTLENIDNGEHNLVVTYTPNASDIKEDATITLTAKDGEETISTTTFTINGRSLPDEFAIVVDKASEYFALPANMPSAGTYPGYSVTLNAGSVTSAPKTHLYTAQAVHNTRFAENGTALRLVGNNNACLWATNAVSGTDIRNYAQLDNAKTADYEWNLYTEDGDTYRISCSIVTEEGRILRMYGQKFGMYKSGAEVFYLLPVECTSTPTNIQVSPARVSATISWENAATCDLQVLKEGTPVQTISGAVSPVVVTGLTELTAYTFTLTPTDAASCKVDGAFTTTGPDIDIVEWMTDGMIIQVDKDDAVNPSVVINGEVEYNTGSGAVATELFFSKYFEAHGENKLLAIYNGTGAPIDLSGYEIKSENGALDLSQFGQIKGQVAPNEEIILVYYDANYPAEECAEQQEGYENWNILTEKSVLAFSGRGSIGLYKDDVLIDVIGSTFPSGELTKIGKSTNGSECEDADVQLYVDEGEGAISVNDQSSFFCYDGDNIKTDEVEDNYAISTNRCLLIRKNTVTSGANAVANNKADDDATCGYLSTTFTTLCSEWSGFRIGGGKSSDEEIREATCDGLGYVGGFDYSKYYREYQQIGDSKKLDEFVYNEDENLYKITIDPLSNYSCLNVSVELFDPETDELLTQQVAQVPIIVASKNTTTDELFSNIIADDLDASKTRCSTCDVVILKNATLTKAAVDTENDVNQVRNIYIYPGGKLVVPADGNDYSVNSLSLRRVEDEVSMASVQTPLLITSSAANPIYVDVRVNSENWHWFTLPYNCNIADVTWADGTPAKYNVDWFLMWYDGESRSNQKSNYESHWKVYEGTTLEAGKGYIVGITGHPTKSKVKYELRFPMAQDVLAVEQTDKTVAVNAWGVKKEIRPNHKGWNLVGNPYMDYYNTASSYSLGGLPLIEYADTYDPITGLWDYEERESGSIPFLVIPQDGGMSEYKQELAADVDMQPFTAYFVQVGDPNNDGHSNGMKLDASFETTKRGRSSLIRRAPSEVDEQEEPAIVAVELTNAKGESDKTTLLIADRFTNEYEMNADFFKWFGDYYTYYTKPVLYTIGADNESRAFNALNEELAAQPVELGMYAAQTGNYTFSLHQRSNLNGVAEVWLHDASNNTHTNLLQDDYTFSTSKTNGAGRFSLSVKMMPKLPTDVENIKQGNVWATTQGNNIVINGLTKDMQLWIYDATGKLLHADRTTNYQHSYSVPQTGAYFVRVHDKNDAQTIKVVVE